MSASFILKKSTATFCGIWSNGWHFGGDVVGSVVVCAPTCPPTPPPQLTSAHPVTTLIRITTKFLLIILVVLHNAR
jgi:hypothetical protein